MSLRLLHEPKSTAGHHALHAKAELELGRLEPPSSSQNRSFMTN